MKNPNFSASWPESWRLSHGYDQIEMFDDRSSPGYTYAYQSRFAFAIDAITRNLSRGSRIIDIAGAQGNFSLRLAELGYRVTWNDLRAELADYVRLKHETGEITYAPGNAFELEFPTRFDGALLTEVIEHVAHPDDFLKKVSQLLRPGGTIVLTTPNGEYFRNTLPKFSDCEDPSVFESMQFKPDSDGHIFLLHGDELRQFAARADLDLLQLAYFTNPLTNGHLKSTALLKVLPYSIVRTVEALSGYLPLAVRRRMAVHLGCVLRRKA